MLKKKKISNIAIITARKGSSRIKDKNIKLFFGKPIIYYSIKTLKKCKIFDEIIVSTNCDKIESISKNFGADKVIRRPNYLSNNKVGIIPVVNHCIKRLAKQNIYPNHICCQFPASPLTLKKNIIFVYNYFKRKTCNIDFIYPSTILKRTKNTKIFNQKKLIRILKINKKYGIVNNFLKDAGQFWYATRTTWMKSNTVYKKGSLTFQIGEETSDIDTIKDWKKVLKIYKAKRYKYSR
tara:strand:+ start:2538 stop:3248 length:711 start_codon:yes stop_codon:yes gene_type:complete